MKSSKIGVALLSIGTVGAIGLGLAGKDEERNRDKAVCETLAEGIAVTREKMPKRLFGDQDHVYFPGEDLSDQISKCHDLGIEVPRAEAAKAIKATFKVGGPVSQELMIDAMR